MNLRDNRYIEMRGKRLFEQTNALCQLFLKMGILGFDLIVYKDEQCVLRHMGGYANQENRIPAALPKRFSIGR